MTNRLVIALVAFFTLGPAVAACLESKPSYRGCSLSVGGEQLEALTENDYVDIVVSSRKKQDAGYDWLSGTILNNKRVLCMRRAVEPDGLASILLELNPFECSSLAISENSGQIVRLSHRARGDIELHSLPVASRSSFLHIPTGITDLDGWNDKAWRDSTITGHRTKRPAEDVAGFPAVPTGYRGLAIVLPAAQTDFLEPGDYVDVTAGFEYAGKTGLPEFLNGLLLSDIRVLRVRKAVGGSARSAVLLQVGPREAQWLAMATDGGRLRLNRRAKGDHEEASRAIARSKYIFDWLSDVRP